MPRFDFLVIGSGIAGLSYALDVAGAGTVAIVTKKERGESSTNYAQGGISCVLGEDDSFDEHVADTLRAGDGLCNETVVRHMVEQGRVAIRNVRHHANDKLKAMEKASDLSEDEAKREHKKIQDLTDGHIKHLDELLKAKEAEVLEV